MVIVKRVARRRGRSVAIGAVTVVFIALGAGAGSASRSPLPPTGALRVDSFAGVLSVDPALSGYYFEWQLEYASCAKLVNYPDAPPPANTRLVPEIAATMPSISGDGRTYTFQIRDDFAFSPPASGIVTAESMKYTFERTLHPDMPSPAISFLSNIEGATEYHNGQAPHISGITAQGSTLTITLIQPQGEFLTILATAWLCAIPTSLPPVPTEGPIPSAGPYYISQYVPNQSIVALRNPNYHGSRPAHFDSIEYTIGVQTEQIRQRVESGVSDYGFELPPAQQAELRDLYGPQSPAAARGLQQWFSNPGSIFDYLPLNNERPLFANVNMRKAVNFAIDRSALAAIRGPTAADPTDQYIPPEFPGFQDAQIYADHPDIEHARDLAGWHPGDPMRPAELWASASTTGHALAEAIRSQLLEIGIDSTITYFQSGLFAAMGTRGAAFDLGPIGWAQDYFDPWDYIQLLDGTTIHNGCCNNNVSYFNDPVFNARMHTARELVGEQRYAAFGQIDVDLARDAAPLAAYDIRNNREFFSRRIGCQKYHASHELSDLGALCLRPEITIDDVQVTEPTSGTVTATFTVRLSSEMDDQVTVDYSTQDGSAHGGEDYVPALGTLSFAPHERSHTISVTVNAGGPGEPVEDFFVDLANQSEGTLVDGRGVGTIQPPPAPPPPPPPPPPPLPPPPPPPPPPPRVRCVVPRVVGQRLAAARARIRRAHCTVGRVRSARSSRRRGRVVSQRPRPGTRLPRGGRVNLVVSRGSR
jgi:peptide/nickel transport system substrate-binding protein